MTYGIGIAHGAGIQPDGTPEIHTLNRLLKLRELLYSGEVERGITTGRYEAKLMAEYAVSKLSIPREKIYVEGRSWSTVSNMYNVRKMVGRWIKEGEIPSDVFLHFIIQIWAKERTKFDVDWVMPMYQYGFRYTVHGIEDGRPEEVIQKVDISKEPKRLRIDRIAKWIPFLCVYRPDIAQLLASLTDPSVFIDKIAYGRKLRKI